MTFALKGTRIECCETIRWDLETSCRCNDDLDLIDQEEFSFLLRAFPRMHCQQIPPALEHRYIRCGPQS